MSLNSFSGHQNSRDAVACASAKLSNQRRPSWPRPGELRSDPRGAEPRSRLRPVANAEAAEKLLDRPATSSVMRSPFAGPRIPLALSHAIPSAFAWLERICKLYGAWITANPPWLPGGIGALPWCHQPITFYRKDSINESSPESCSFLVMSLMAPGPSYMASFICRSCKLAVLCCGESA